MNTLLLLIRTTRPAQWVKNLFVAAPVLFAKEHTALDPALIWQALLASCVFILLSGSVYVMNDILDAPKDRLHPIKRSRPVASGELSIQSAMTGGLLLLVAALTCGYFLGADFNLTATGYLALNVAYTGALKKVVWVDVVSIATGFLLRILAGCFAIGLAPAEISYYLILCTFLIALFLALGKRRHELSVIGSDDARKVLGSYRIGQLDAALYTVALLTIAAYVMYTISDRTREYFGTYGLVYTAPFVAAGIYRFLSLLKRKGDQRSPTDVMIRDVPFVLNITFWAAMVVWVVYL